MIILLQLHTIYFIVRLIICCEKRTQKIFPQYVESLHSVFSHFTIVTDCLIPLHTLGTFIYVVFLTKCDRVVFEKEEKSKKAILFRRHKVSRSSSMIYERLTHNRFIHLIYLEIFVIFASFIHAWNTFEPYVNKSNTVPFRT